MNKGVVQQIDAPMKIYERPMNLFVAGFLGNPAMNQLRGRVRDDGAALEGQRRDVADSADAERLRDREIVVGVRPEDIQRVDARASPRTALASLRLSSSSKRSATKPSYTRARRVAADRALVSVQPARSRCADHTADRARAHAFLRCGERGAAPDLAGAPAAAPFRRSGPTPGARRSGPARETCGTAHGLPPAVHAASPCLWAIASPAPSIGDLRHFGFPQAARREGGRAQADAARAQRRTRIVGNRPACSRSDRRRRGLFRRRGRRYRRTAQCRSRSDDFPCRP